MTKTMKNSMTVLMLAAVMIAASIGIGMMQGASDDTVKADTAQGEANKNTVTVSGEGEIKVTPDVAHVNAAVQSEADTAQEAQSANAAVVEKVNKVLKDEYGIKAEDIQTTGFQVHPRYYYPENKEPQIAGYTATHTLRITYRDLAKVGDLLDDLSQAGVNQIHHIEFGTEKSDEYKLEALKKAMAHAKEKAKVLVSAENESLKGVLHITETGSSAPAPYVTKYYAEESAARDSASTSVAGGQITISASVNVTYEF